MALSNFLLTVVGVSAVVLMLKGDVRRAYPTLRRNVRQVREWLEQEQATTGSRAEHGKPREVESGKTEKQAPKSD